MKKQKCCLCGIEFEGYGNNSQPLADGKCCDKCNLGKVIPERLIRSKENKIKIKDKFNTREEFEKGVKEMGFDNGTDFEQKTRFSFEDLKGIYFELINNRVYKLDDE